MKDIREPEVLRTRLLRPQVLRDPSEENRISTWLELFFDLCFVVAVAALAKGLHDDPTFGGALRFAAFFIPVWWAWMGFTWYATAFDNDDVARGDALHTLASRVCLRTLQGRDLQLRACLRGNEAAARRALCQGLARRGERSSIRRHVRAWERGRGDDLALFVARARPGMEDPGCWRSS